MAARALAEAIGASLGVFPARNPRFDGGRGSGREGGGGRDGGSSRDGGGGRDGGGCGGDGGTGDILRSDKGIRWGGGAFSSPGSSSS